MTFLQFRPENKKINGALLAACLLLTQFTAQSQSFKFTSSPDGIALSEGGRGVYFYQKTTRSLDGEYPRANYLHPLYGLNGEVLTEDFPADHLHHRGVFWAWHQVLVDTVRVGDGWECKGIEWRVTNTNTDVQKGKALLDVTVDWNGSVNGKPTTFLREHTLITTLAATAQYRVIDFDINLTAQSKDVWLGGSEDHKGYSGFSARLKLPGDMKFLSTSGEMTPVEPAIKGGGWVDVLGTFDKKKSGVTIMVDTTLSAPFHGWILRNKTSMQNAAFPGREPVRIPAGETLRLRYRLVVHQANLKVETIDKLYQQFTANQ